MSQYSKLSYSEIEAILEIPGDDGGLTDIENESDDEFIFDRDYLDVPKQNVQLDSLNIMGMFLIFLKIL